MKFLQIAMPPSWKEGWDVTHNFESEQSKIESAQISDQKILM